MLSGHTRDLRDVAELTMGQSPPSETVNDASNLPGLPFLQGNAEFGDPFPSAKYTCIRPLRSCSTGDALISVRAPVGATNRADRAYCIGRGLASISFRGVDPDYGWHSINRRVSSLRSIAQGTTFEAVGKRELGSLKISFPEPALQRIIAAILDTADEAIRSDRTTYRQAANRSSEVSSTTY